MATRSQLGSLVVPSSLAAAVVGALLWAPLAAQESKPTQESKPQEPIRRSSIPAPPTPGGQTPVGPPRLPADATRESMWPAPTAADWKKPCLIEFQRTWDDALAIAKQTKKPILCCINMDGEIASEHWAGVRYRTPEQAALFEPYVCVIASVYRHTPRDYDEEGKRILCPRFGSVTCGEHIAIEPILYEKFMEGRRISPRHICVEPDQKMAETFDVFYTWDTASVVTTLKAGAADRPTPIPLPRGDRPITERVLGNDIADRTAVEAAYAAGDAALRKKLLEQTLTHRDLDQVDMLRLAIFGVDPDLARTARKALAQCQSESAVELIADALRVPMAPEEREALVGALGRLGQTFPRARTLAAVFKGLAGRSSSLDVEAWSKALAAAPSQPPPDRDTLQTRASYQAEAAEADKKDAAARVALADSYVALASDPRTSGRFSRVYLEDARRVAEEARALGASDWRVHASLAIAAFKLGDLKQAYASAEAAVAAKPADVQDANSMQVFALFAEGRQQAIWNAMREKKEWPSQWLTDVNAAYSVLAVHPYGTDNHVAAHVDFLGYLGAKGQAATVLEAGLARFPESWVLHDRLRTQVLADKGVQALERVYTERLAKSDAARNERWFAGYASLVTAEYQRRARKPELAVAAYQRAIEHYERASTDNPVTRDTCDHYIALALAGRARIELERGELEAAVADLLASFRRHAESAASLDGLNLSPVDTAKMLQRRAEEAKRTDLVQKVKAALEALDPRMLELPAYEREVPASQPQSQRRGRRR